MIKYLNSNLDPTLFNEVLSLFDDANIKTKHLAKSRLSKKYNWLIYKHYNSDTDRYSPNVIYTLSSIVYDPWYTPPRNAKH